MIVNRCCWRRLSTPRPICCIWFNWIDSFCRIHLGLCEVWKLASLLLRSLKNQRRRRKRRAKSDPQMTISAYNQINLSNHSFSQHDEFLWYVPDCIWTALHNYGQACKHTDMDQDKTTYLRRCFDAFWARSDASFRAWASLCANANGFIFRNMSMLTPPSVFCCMVDGAIGLALGAVVPSARRMLSSSISRLTFCRIASDSSGAAGRAGSSLA